ncbi:cellulose binding domain-containing protein, partial [Micromonospora zhanjiangensis]
APTTPAPTTPAPTTPAPGGGCTARYAVTGSWSGGFQAEVKVTYAGAATIGWTTDFSFPGGQRIASSWNATVSQSGQQVTAANAAYYGRLAPGASTSWGLVGTGDAGSPPAVTCTAR